MQLQYLRELIFNFEIPGCPGPAPSLSQPSCPVLEIEQPSSMQEDQRDLGGPKNLIAEEAQGTKQLGGQTKFKKQKEDEY